jgi:hypothetical protein
MRRTNIYLDEEQTAALDERARAQGVSRAELIRRILARELEGTSSSHRRELLRQAIRESFGVLADEEFDDLRSWQSERERYLAQIWER